jgi:Cytochrome C biogenesis protein transmembrane region
MELALVLSAFMLGLAGTPHCAAMCGASCAGVLQGCSSGTDARPTALAFHAARVAGYAVAGALAAAGVGVLAMAGSAAPLVRPIWTLLHVAALALGLWLMITGRQPAFMTRVGRSRSSVPAAAGGGWQTMGGRRRGVGRLALRAVAVGARRGGSGQYRARRRGRDGRLCHRLGDRASIGPVDDGAAWRRVGFCGLRSAHRRGRVGCRVGLGHGPRSLGQGRRVLHDLIHASRSASIAAPQTAMPGQAGHRQSVGAGEPAPCRD